jgi:hypothetical protein
MNGVFIARKIENIRGKPTPACTDNIVPYAAPCTVNVQLGGEAVTEGGKLLPNSRMKTFIDLVKDRPVYLALSGRTMEFDVNAKCVAGC